MKRENEIWVIGTEPPCPRCHHLSAMVHELASELGLSIRIRHLAYTEAEAMTFATEMRLEPGTAKDVARKGDISIDWSRVYQLAKVPPQAVEEAPEDVCCPSVAPWTPELDEILRPCEERALDLGIMMTPVLVLSGRIFHQGSVPSKEKTRDWLIQVYGEEIERPEGNRLVEVLGPGCANCEKVYQNAFEAVKRLGLDEETRIVKVTDIREFAKRGVSTTPGLVIGGRVVSTGKVLDVARIMEMLKGT
ncbi:putative redox-active disulfide protein 2 [delta proteobacterium NaphS2]|nr:putative redox-active disulfide protein 2 [delta proteobacterium NaphS2]